MTVRRRVHGPGWWSLLLICLVLSLASGREAFAGWEPDPDQPMRFVVVRSDEAGCEPNCPEWISAEGAITAKSPALLKAALKALGRRKLPIVVNSPGGDVDAALAMGRLIRKNKLDIAVGRTWFQGCPGVKDCKKNDVKGSAYIGGADVDGSFCASACPLMLAGGTRRLVGPLAFLGVHQITSTIVTMNVQYIVRYRIVKGKKRVISKKVVSRKNTGSYKSYEMSKAVERRLSAYLKEMGVDQGVLEVMKSTPASDIQQIALDDLVTMKLVTSEDAVDLLTSASLCNGDPAPNCRQLPGLAARANEVAKTAKPAATKPGEPQAAKVSAEMRFVVVRGSNPLCNPDCPEWISAEGTITPQTPQKLSQLLATLGDRRLPVVINSQGGDLFGALAAGRLIHEKKLDAAIAHTDFVACDPEEWNCLAENGAYAGLSVDSGAECDSACALMLAGGARRLVGSQAKLSLYLMGQKQVVRAYLKEMEISPILFKTLEGSSVERQFEPDLMERVGLTTGRQSVDALTGSSVCRSEPRPLNCRALPSPSDAQAAAPAKL